MNQVAIRRAKKFEDVAHYYYDHGDISQGDQYQARANQYWHEGGKPQKVRALRGRGNPMRTRTRRYYRNPARRSSTSSGMSDGTKLALVVGGIAAVAGIGYLVYQSQSSASAATAAGGTGGGTLTGGGTTTLGPGGSSVPLPTVPSSGTPATDGTMPPTAGVTDTTPTQYEAGPGANAPLVATG